MNYDYWTKALADPKALRNREFRITSDAQPGFYRDYGGRPVAIWQDDEVGIVITVNGEEIDEKQHETTWLACAKNPVSEEWFRAVEDGGVWPDLDALVSGIGDNRRGSDVEGLIDELAEKAIAYGPINDDEEASRAISLRAAILEQHKRADKEREQAKAPYLKQAREVDEIWMPMVKKAKSAADRLRALVEGWETTKRRKAREAEAARLEAERLAQPMILEDGPVPTDQIRSGYGRAVSVRTKMVVTGIKDLDEAIKWYRGDSRLADALKRMAQDDVASGDQAAGFTYEEQAVVR
jgi:hypothetical protein